MSKTKRNVLMIPSRTTNQKLLTRTVPPAREQSHPACAEDYVHSVIQRYLRDIKSSA